MTVPLPFALDARGNVVSALTSPAGKPLLCLECGGPVRVQRPEPDSKVRFAPHFVHLTDTLCPGTADSVTRKAARRRLKLQLVEQLKNTGGFQLAEWCPGFGGPCATQSVVLRDVLVQGWTAVGEDQFLPLHGQVWGCDVAILGTEGILVGFQVFLRAVPPLAGARPEGRPWFAFMAEDLVQHKPLLPYPSTVSSRLCPDCLLLQARHAARAQQTSSEPTSEWQRVVQHWQDITSRQAVEQLTAPLERTPRERAVKLLADHGIRYRDLKDWKLVTLLIPCPRCARETVFATSKPQVVRDLGERLKGLVEWPPGERRHMHVCLHCQGQQTEEWFWESWRAGLGERV